MRCWVVGADWLEVIEVHRCGSGWGEGALGTLTVFGVSATAGVRLHWQGPLIVLYRRRWMFALGGLGKAKSSIRGGLRCPVPRLWVKLAVVRGGEGPGAPGNVPDRLATRVADWD